MTRIDDYRCRRDAVRVLGVEGFVSAVLGSFCDGRREPFTSASLGDDLRATAALAGAELRVHEGARGVPAETSP